MPDAIRSQRLKRFFATVAEGKRGVKGRDDAMLLLEAICDQESPVRCVSMLMSKKHALRALQQSVCIDVSPQFLNGLGAQFIRYVTDENVHWLNGGHVLRDLLGSIVDPPLLWDAFQSAAERRYLTSDGLEAFGLLILDFLALFPPSSELSTKLNVQAIARSVCPSLLQSHAPAVRSIGYKIKEAVRNSTTAQDGPAVDMAFKPGGRHDNDFEDFRKIAIFPTTDELLSKDEPFYRTADAVLQTDPANRIAAHLDNQFRLSREDFMAELRQDLEASSTPKTKTKRQGGLRLRGLQLSGINAGASTRLRAPTIALRCWDGRFRGLPESEEERKKHLAQDRSLLKHGSFGCLMCGPTVIAFATIERDEEQLAKNPSVVLLRVLGRAAVQKTLCTLKTKLPHDIEFVSVGTPFFAYEPILTGLQEMPSLPLAKHLLGLGGEVEAATSPLRLERLAALVESCEASDLRPVLDLPKETKLDHSQTMSLVAGLTQAVSLIQGPPGTGKSFLGAILTKAFLDHTKETILVLCYTNHALDQFLEDIMDMGVPKEQMIRLGSKSTARTQSLGLFEQSKDVRVSRDAWWLRKTYQGTAEDTARNVETLGNSFSRWKLSDSDLLESLEFSDEDSRFFEALSVPQTQDDMIVVGEDGKAIDSLYLMDRWRQGKDAGIFRDMVQWTHSEVWSMSRVERAQRCAQWTQDATCERAQVLCEAIDQCTDDFGRWVQHRDGKAAEVLKSRRLIGCTTTAAAKYANVVAQARPGIVLVEEAGEVLESHVVTALRRETKHLVLIGDHLQLRPKVINHHLTVEKGEGYDLNRSLFERLVISGYPHTVLTQQHRMRPEVSALVRRLTYPSLEDGERTQSRDNIRGLQSNVIFIDHDQLEVSNDLRKGGANNDGYKKTRQNIHEASLVLKVVRYLAQQGYGTDNQVVLTPYLGQLRLLMDHLKADHDPVLSDLDSHDLVKAGLLSPASASMTRQPLRISTIDNFQGEESDIVIVSLTRGNKTGDIGFLSEPQRLNVLLSRARNGLILIGNTATFRASKKGRKVWIPFLEQLSGAGQLHDGLPVKCEQHPTRCVTLKSTKDFDSHCPNGGCDEPCRAMLGCGKHCCPEKCHQLADHSKMRCQHIVESQCARSHEVRWQCWQKSKPCAKCERQDKEAKAKQERDMRLAMKREEREKAYLEKLKALDDEIAAQRGMLQDGDDEASRERTLEQRQRDLAQVRVLAQQKATGAQQPPPPTTNPPIKSKIEEDKVEDGQRVPNASPTRQAWECQKLYENAANEHIDALMGMTGLEAVKQQVLAVKDKIDTALRQGARLADERFGAVLLGNPGTGKTTVARLYAKCLASMGVVAGSRVEETTASKLTNGGVAALQKLVDTVLNAGGGAIFIDEAYQLATESSPTGKQILDSLLDEVENLRGKIVFLLAGYKQEMEALLAHNPGLPSRFPHELTFEDYEDSELLDIFQQQVRDRLKGQMKLEGGHDGLYSRIAARRVGHGRGRPGFGNARAMENALAKIRSRQAARVSGERRKGHPFDDFLFTKEDLIGPEPASALEQSKAWEELQGLIGLTEVKQSVKALTQSLRYNYERELREEALLTFNLNRVFLGSPGTGKTTVAKLYGKVLADLGLLSNGQVVAKNPSDFVGEALGVSEKNTRGILAATVGKVLIIDEAYGLSASSGGGGQSHDPYKSSVIDTLVAEIQSVPGEDRCVLLLGYKPQMEAMFQNANPGLSRRFPMSEAFVFEDFTDEELKRVVELKLKQQDYSVTDDAMQTIMDSLERARNKPNFGNAGEVDILLNGAKARHQKRWTWKDSPQKNVLEAVDIDPHFDRVQGGKLSVRDLFQDTVGAEEVIRRLERIQRVAVNMRTRGLDVRGETPFNFLFVGPPGTGKTTTARKMGKIYYDIGILATNEVLEVSATDLMGEFVGQTGPKTQKLLEKALGKVLFIDEAYRLAEGHFAKEAMDEIVDRLTKPEFARRLIVILAGYDRDMQRLMAVNPGLTSRFPESITFGSLSPQDCFSLLLARLEQKLFIDSSKLKTMSEELMHELEARFATLTSICDWANARDVGTLASTIASYKLETANTTSNEPIIVAAPDVLQAMDRMIRERQKLATYSSKASADTASSNLPVQERFPFADSKPPQLLTAEKTMDIDQEAPETPEEEDTTKDYTEPRDAGVSDVIWATLELDKQRAADDEKRYADLIARQTYLEDEQMEYDFVEASYDNEKATDGGNDESDNEERRRREQERLAREILRRQKGEELAKLRGEREETERKRREEQQSQRKLRQMGVCPVGYRWIRQPDGYRCAGGSHFVSNQVLKTMS